MNVSSYRPVLNLPHVSKILERIFNGQLITHLEQNKLLPDVQSAYRHGHSTKSAVLKIYSDIIDAIANGKFALLLLIDLTAAFDTVDHEILLHRLETTFGLRCTILQWLGSYLQGRTQSVLLNGQSTVAQTMVCDVPQRSMLGPLHFTLYTMDIGKLIQHSYADDNELYASCIPSESVALKAKMIHCFASVGKCLATNQLMLYPSKSKFMWRASQRRIHLIDRCPFALPDVPVSVATLVRNLGAYFNECMSMEKDVNRLVRLCFYQLQRIRFIHHSLSIAVATSLTNSFIIAIVDYCNNILAGLTKHQPGESRQILNVAARVIYGQARFDHIIQTLRDRLHWLRVPKGLNSSGACSCTKQFTGWHQLTSPTTGSKFHQDDASIHPRTGDSTFPLLPRR